MTLYEKLQKVSPEDKIIIPRKDKRSRREVLEEYLMASIIQGDDPKKIINENQEMFNEYKFELSSLQKILEIY